MKKTNYFLNFVKSYRNIFLKVLFFEIFYSIRFGSLVPKMKIQNDINRTDTIPCIYYFLHEISKFLKQREIKSIVDIGSGFGRVVNFLSYKNNIKSYGIEYDKQVHEQALKIKNRKTSLYCGDVLDFNLRKLNSRCFILVDPFKKIEDRNKILNKIKRLYPNKKKYIIAVNNYKGGFPKYSKLIKSIIASKTRTLKIFEIS